MNTTGTGGDLVYAALRAVGVECVFGVPSQQNLMLYDALARHGDIRVIGARHEQGAVHAADGYARATGKLGVAIVSTGPGTANAMNGLYEAAFASSPVLLLTTQVDRIHLGKNRGFIHQADRQLEMLRTVVRRAERPMDVDRIAETVLDVIRDIRTGRPQPGAVEIPTDLLGAPCTASLNLVWHEPAPLPAPDVTAAAATIAAAQRPLLWIGGGCTSANAGPAVAALAERLGAAVVSSPNGRGVMPDDHPLYLGTLSAFPAIADMIEQADCVIAIGTRFQAVPSRFYSLHIRNLVHIDADPQVIGTSYPPRHALIGDARLTAEALCDALARHQPATDQRADAAAARKAATLDHNTRIGPDHAAIRDAVNRVLPARRHVVADATMAGSSWGMNSIAAPHSRSTSYSTSLAIGPALPLGLGAAIGSGQTTLVIHGDGGVMLNLPELATIAETGAPVITLIFNNQGYGVLKYIQSMTTQRPFAVDLLTPDFVTIGAAMGMPAYRVNTTEAFEAQLAACVTAGGPAVIEVDISAMEPVRF